MVAMRRFAAFWIATLALTMVYGADLEEVLKRVSETQREMKTMKAHFIQEKNSAFFEEPQVSKGELTYVAPDKIRWEYASPSPMTILVDGDLLTFYDVEQKKVESKNIDPESESELKEMLNAIITGN